MTIDFKNFQKYQSKLEIIFTELSLNENPKFNQKENNKFPMSITACVTQPYIIAI